MKYQFMVRSRPDERMEARHTRLRKCLAALDGDWVVTNDKWPVAKDPRTLPMRMIHLSRCFGKGIDAYVSYQNRKYFRDESKFDDHLKLEFDPEKVDYKSLVSIVALEVIQAFRAYRARLGPDDIVTRDWDKSIAVEAKRSGVYRVYPVSFWDNELCKRSFDLSPKEIAHRLKGAVERAELVANGVWVVATSEIVDLKKANAIHRRIKPLLESNSA